MVTKEQILELIKLHNYMQGSYFWMCPKQADSKRWYEKNYSLTVEGIFNNKKISLNCKTDCSHSIVYYKGTFFIDGKKVTIREVKKLIN